MEFNNCSDFFYTLPNTTELCTGTLETRHEVVLLVIRTTYIAICSLFSILYILPVYRYETERRKRKRQSQRFKRVASRAFLAGNMLMSAFYILGNHFRYTHFSDPLGILCCICIIFGSIFIFMGAGVVLIMVMQIYLSSCGETIRLSVDTSLRPMWRFIAPYTLIMTIALVLSFAGVIENGIVATQVGLGGAIPSVIMYFRETSLYITPVIKTMRQVAGLGSDEKYTTGSDVTLAENMKSRIQFLMQQRTQAKLSCGTSIVMFAVLGFSPVIHESSGLVFLVAQTYNSFTLVLPTILAFPLLCDRAGKRVSPVARAKIAMNSLFSSSSQSHHEIT